MSAGQVSAGTSHYNYHGSAALSGTSHQQAQFMTGSSNHKAVTKQPRSENRKSTFIETPITFKAEVKPSDKKYADFIKSLKIKMECCPLHSIPFTACYVLIPSFFVGTVTGIVAGCHPPIAGAAPSPYPISVFLGMILVPSAVACFATCVLFTATGCCVVYNLNKLIFAAGQNQEKNYATLQEMLNPIDDETIDENFPDFLMSPLVTRSVRDPVFVKGCSDHISAREALEALIAKKHLFTLNAITAEDIVSPEDYSDAQKQKIEDLKHAFVLFDNNKLDELDAFIEEMKGNEAAQNQSQQTVVSVSLETT